MKCKRCEQEIEADAPPDVVICGSCTDELRQEETAMIEQAQAKDIEFEMNRETYEERLRRFDEEDSKYCP